METSIDKLMEPPGPQHIVQEEQASAGFANGPMPNPHVVQQQPIGMIPTGPSQGNSTMFAKEAFGSQLQNLDYISILIVFMLLMLTTTGVSTYPFKTIGLMYQNGSLTMFGSIIISILLSLVFALIVIFIPR